MMVPLGKGAKRPAVLLFQRGYNARAAMRGWPPIAEDSENGPNTVAAAIRAGRALGAMEATLAAARKTGIVSVGLQRMVRWPEKRSRAQLARAKERSRAQQAATAGPQAALAWARKWIGKTETPAGSNRGDWGLTAWQEALGPWLVGQAWCGVLVGTALRHAGVRGINSRVAAVRFILEDAGAGRNGWASVVYRRSSGQGSVTHGLPGDAVGLFGEGTHVGMIEKRIPGGYQTVEGNTSSGNGGSQSNGGGCFRRTRSDRDVVYIARARYLEV